MKHFQTIKNPIITDSLFGIIIGAIVLHPFSMLVGGGGLHGHNNIVFLNFVETICHPMSFYFIVIGFLFGMLSGYFRSKLKYQNKLLQNQTYELIQTLAEKNSLLRIISNDLRNYISNSYSYTEIIIFKNNLQKETTLKLQKIKSYLSQTIELLNQIKSLIAIESGKTKLAIIEADIKNIVEESIELFYFKTLEKKINIEFEYEKEKTYLANVNPIIFKTSVVNNLISNAIKFAFSDTIVIIQIFFVENELKISVTNKGFCIPKEKIEYLFNPTIQVATKDSISQPESGLGLPLAIKFLNMMNGSLEVENFYFDKKYQQLQYGDNSGLITLTISLPASYKNITS